MLPVQQGRYEVRWRQGQETTLAPQCRNWDLSEANVLYWRKPLWYCWDFRRPGNRGLLASLVTSLLCRPWFRSRSAWYQGRNEVKWCPEQGAPMCESEVVWKQIYCFEGSICDTVGDFRHPPQSFCAPIVIRGEGKLRRRKKLKLLPSYPRSLHPCMV